MLPVFPAEFMSCTFWICLKFAWLAVLLRSHSEASANSRPGAVAQKVLSVRAEFLAPGAPVSDPARTKKRSRRAGSEIGPPTKTATLADLHDPLAPPPTLQKAHEQLARVLDLCYRKEPFMSERPRVEFLFALHEKLTALLFLAAKPARARPQPVGWTPSALA